MTKMSRVAMDEINAHWGDPRRVANIAFNEIFRYRTYDGGGFDADDQVEDALSVGVLAGELKDSDPRTFAEQFETKFLNDG